MECFGRYTTGNAIKPTSDIPTAYRPSSPSQDQENRLERIFGVLRVAQHAATNGEHLGSVPPHQHLERGRVAAGDKLLQQLRIRQPINRWQTDQAAHIAHHRGSLAVGHGPRSPEDD